MKKLIITVIILALIGAGAFAWYKYGRPEEETKFTYLKVTRGDVVESVGATGTLQAVTTVTVGSPVSGNIKALYADFNSIVKKGQVVAELDPSLMQTQLEQSKANLTRSETDRDKSKVSLDDAKNKLARTRSLFDRKIATQQDLETAEVTVRSAEASLKSSEAAIIQSKASLDQQQVNVDHCIIYAPIDGIVTQRSVDVGQTVAASMNAPTIFIIAADLTAMQVLAKIDESDIGRIRPNQPVTFRVDAFPNENFTGHVSQLRLNPVVSQNVVTYDTVISVPNNALRLRPGMTANVTIEIARRSDVLRLPNAALRYRPNADIFTELHLPVPPELVRGAGRGGQAGQGGARGQGQGATPAAGTTPAAGAPGAPAAATAVPAAPGANAPAADASRQGAGRQRGQGDQQAQGGGRQRAQGDQAAGGRGDQAAGGQGGGRSGGGRQSMQERMAAMTPAEREAFIARMKERGIDPNNPSAGRGGQGGGRGGGRGGADANAAPAQGGLAAMTAAKPGAQTIDQLFGALPTVVRNGTVWVGFPDKPGTAAKLTSVRVRTGITDGTWTELVSAEPDLVVDQELVSNVMTPAMVAAAANRSPGQQQNNGRGQQNQNPFQQGGGGGGRGPGGPGGGR